MHAVNLLAGKPVSDEQILQLTAGLGSDVPFFASGAALAIGRGRGEQLTILRPLRTKPVLVVQPEFGMSTKTAYDLLSASRKGSSRPSCAALSLADPPSWSSITEVSENDFEPSLFDAEPRLGEIFGRMETCEPMLTRMCGSGSAIIGIFASEEQRDTALDAFPDASRVIPSAVCSAAAPCPVLNGPK
jgi:4-diphosphocytidyl-2-C-methyl-D-erythritol kinase